MRNSGYQKTSYSSESKQKSQKGTPATNIVTEQQIRDKLLLCLECVAFMNSDDQKLIIKELLETLKKLNGETSIKDYNSIQSQKLPTIISDISSIRYFGNINNRSTKCHYNNLTLKKEAILYAKEASSLISKRVNYIQDNVSKPKKSSSLTTEQDIRDQLFELLNQLSSTQVTKYDKNKNVCIANIKTILANLDGEATISTLNSVQSSFIPYILKQLAGLYLKCRQTYDIYKSYMDAIEDYKNNTNTKNRLCNQLRNVSTLIDKRVMYLQYINDKKVKEKKEKKIEKETNFKENKEIESLKKELEQLKQIVRGLENANAHQPPASNPEYQKMYSIVNTSDAQSPSAPPQSDEDNITKDTSAKNA